MVQLRKVVEKLLLSHSPREILEDILHRYPRALQTGLTTAPSRIHPNELMVVHQTIVQEGRALQPNPALT